MVSLSTSCWGAERSLLELADHLPADLRLRVHAPAGELLDAARGHGLPVRQISEPAVLWLREVGFSVGRTAYAPTAARATAALARSPLWAADVVIGFSQWLHLPLAAAGRLRHRRVVLDLHDGPFTRFGAAVQAAGAAVAPRGVAVSRTALEHIGHYPHGRMRIVPRPVQVPESLHGVALRRPHPVDAAPLALAIVGRIDAEKRVELGLRAHQRMVRAGRRVTLTVIGAASKGQGDAQLRSRYPAADFRGRLPHDRMLAELARADVLLSLAPGEAFGRTVFEAALLGVPALVAATGGPAEAVRHLRTGVVVPPDDEGALLAALEGMAADRRLPRVLGRAAHHELGPYVEPATVARRWVAAVLGHDEGAVPGRVPVGTVASGGAT